MLTIKDTCVAPAICYESLQDDHSASAIALGAQLYVASVSKTQRGFEKGAVHYPAVAKKYSIPVLMSNPVGESGDGLSVGMSSIWNKEGNLLGQLPDGVEGVLFFDTETEEVTERRLNE
jgi:predicted amidohydrolase